MDRIEDDILVPTIFITADWSIDDLETIDDCEDAFAVLTAIIVSLEDKILQFEQNEDTANNNYYGAKRALRWKKAALNCVNKKSARINKDKAEKQRREFSSFLEAYLYSRHSNVLKECQAEYDLISIGKEIREEAKAS